ncbi:MAG: Redox-active disulfide protein 2 [Synergistales bacterium 54_9]|jgi:ArsR family transcriptional regulator|nr:MAG: Redox-active disulfide protein 2 [Synergistales bacterium 54_9]MDN5336465.1 ArsR family transcriptional regulator, arsenate/arsenite/antimonite-responsive transcriptional [Synergistales bacterium]HAG22596.1 transcriptional regulator [Synergistaceae bacterium]
MTLLEKKVQIFKALAHPVRLGIVEKLAEGERCVCDIAEWFDCDRTTISKHLSILKNAGIIADRKEGLKVNYSLRLTCILPVLECVEGKLLDNLRKEFESCCGMAREDLKTSGGIENA